MSDFSSDEEEVCQRPQRPKQQSNHIGGYDFFDIAGKDVKTIMQSMDELPDFEQESGIAAVKVLDSDTAGNLDYDSDKETIQEPPKRESLRSKRKQRINPESDSDLEVISEQKPKKTRETTPPLEISALKEAVSIKSTPKKAVSSRLRLDDVTSISSSSQVQLVIKVEPLEGKAFKLRIFDDVPLKEVFHQSALVT
jgi:hypothetical protein